MSRKPDTVTSRRHATVPFLDLGRRVQALQPELSRAIEDVIDRGRFILGERVAEVEERFAAWCGVAYGIGVASGTDAIRLALEGVGIGPGDEVITAANTCAPTVVAILDAGAQPVLVDVDPVTYTLDPGRLADSITAATRCVVPVHLYGQCADMDAMLAIAAEYGLPVVEDCAQAHGARVGERAAGSMGTAGCFSFYPTKNLGALGDGGMIITDDASLADRLRLLRNYGYASPNLSAIRGHNSRLDELQAAILLAQLDQLDDWNRRRRAIAARYDAAFADEPRLRTPIEAAERHHVYHLYVVRHLDRDRFRECLREAGVGTLVHYPTPPHWQPGLRDLVHAGAGGLDRTEGLAAEILSLPLFPELRDSEVDRVIEVVVATADP
jgi:dTDP-3-amino-3,4,6-trideoxy-alpha-D-glucose transaminase